MLGPVRYYSITTLSTNSLLGLGGAGGRSDNVRCIGTAKLLLCGRLPFAEQCVSDGMRFGFYSAHYDVGH